MEQQGSGDYDPLYQQPSFPDQDMYPAGGASPKRPSGPMILLILGGFGLLCVLLCCGGGWLVVNFGFNVIETQVANQLRDNPVIRQHIGDIQSCDMDFAETVAESEDEVAVFRLTGSKGEGVLIAETESLPDGGEEVLSATLRLPSGETVDVPIE